MIGSTLALLLAQVTPAERAETVNAPAETIVDAAHDASQRLTVPVMIAGHGPFRFLVDTGAQATVVTPALVARLGLPAAGMAWVVGTDSRVLVPVFTMDDLEFADRSFSNLVVPQLEARNIGADGILGLDALQDLRVLLDFRARELRVADALDLGGDKGYEIVVRARRRLGRMIIADARVAGVRTAVIVDTGANTSIGNLALQARLRTRPGATVTSRDVNGVEATRTLALVRNITIDRLQLADMPMSFTDSPAFRELGLSDKPALILGMRDLRTFERVAIDFRRARVLFDVPDSQIHLDRRDASRLN